MADLLSILRDRQRQTRAPEERRVFSALVLRPEGPRYLVSDGGNSYLADSGASEIFHTGDRVWVVRDGATTLIVGLQGRDVDMPL